MRVSLSSPHSLMLRADTPAAALLGYPGLPLVSPIWGGSSVTNTVIVLRYSSSTLFWFPQDPLALYLGAEG